jgi:glutathione S-transferase
MLTLCGFPVSNYYNKVKLALLEKGVPFNEDVVPVFSTDDAVLAASPLAKIPYIRTPEGGLCESQAIMEYIEAAYPQPPLLPADPFAAAKVRELITFIDLHLELVARELYPQAFFGGTVSEATQARVRKQLDKNIAAFKQLVKFSPYGWHGDQGRVG